MSNFFSVKCKFYFFYKKGGLKYLFENYNFYIKSNPKEYVTKNDLEEFINLCGGTVIP